MSNQLEIANQKLLELRAQAQVSRLPGVSSRFSGPLTAVPHNAPGTADNLRNEGAAVPAAAPSWAMKNALLQVNRLQEMRGIKLARRQTPVDNSWIAELAETAVSIVPSITVVETAVSVPLPIDGQPDVKVWPALASALHKAGYAPHNRLYTAAQLLDPARSGRIDAPLLRSQFTDENNGRYLFGWRRVRQILNSGDGILWDWNRKTDRIHLRGPRRIAEALDLERVDRAVMVPMSILFNGQGEFNAHIHAAWLTGHGDEDKPISQAAIEAATAVPSRTQRHYNKLAKVQKQKNIEIGEQHTEVSEEETAWQYGRNSFEFIDYQGRQGKPDGRYRARRLPNSYRRRHRLAAKGRRGKINRGLARLVNMETRGSSSSPLIKLYHTDGRSAAQSHSKRPDTPVYWPGNSRAGAFEIWHVLS